MITGQTDMPLASTDDNLLVIAEVVDVQEHPNASMLSVCQVSDGSQVLQVVCGAPNVAVGAKVVLAKVGARLPGLGFQIKPAKLRGIESYGMLCAADELGISADHTGLIIIDPTIPLGTPARIALEMRNGKQEQTGARPSSSLAGSSGSKSRTRREGDECRALMETCTPLVYRHNAFRITGLPVDATTRDIKRRLDDLKHAEELGDAEQEHRHAFAITPPPGLDHIRESAHRLHDPERRIVEEFFWFWPCDWGNGKEDDALLALMNGDKDAAFKKWSDHLSYDHSKHSVIAKHNLAVMYHLVALDSEHVALETDLPAEQLTTISQYWRTCFKWWEELTDDETFWSLLTDRIRMLDDPRLTTGMARRMRATLPEAMDKINAMLAIQFIECDRLALAANHIAYMKETHEGLDDVARTLGHVTKPLRSRIETAVERATTTASHDPAKAYGAAMDLLTTAEQPLRILELVLPKDDPAGRDINDSVVNACLVCARSFARKTNQWDGCLLILDKASRIARSQEAKTELDSAITEARRNKDLAHPSVREVLAIRQRISGLDTLEQLKEVYRSAPAALQSVEAVCGGRTSKPYEICADSIAGCLRGIAVDLYNKVGDSTPPAVGFKLLVLSLEIHDRAASLAVSMDMKSRFREDESVLSEFRATLARQGTRDSVRRELIREGLLPVWDEHEAPPPVPPQHRRHEVGRQTARSQSPPPVQPQHRKENVGSPSVSGHAPPPVASQHRRETIGPRASAQHQEKQATPQNTWTPATKKQKSAGWALVVGSVIVIGILISISNSETSTSRTSPSTHAPPSSRSATYSPPRSTFNQPAQALPYNGWVQRYHTSEAIAPLQIVTRSADSHYFVKIVDFYTERLVATVFVRGGYRAELDVPLGSYKLKYATGSTWYGTQYLFGPTTSYSQADERFDFRVSGSQVSGYTVELYMQRNGNLETSRISAADF